MPPGHDDATEGIAGDAEGDPVDMVGPADESTSQTCLSLQGESSALCSLQAGCPCLTLQPGQFSFQCSKVLPVSVEGSKAGLTGLDLDSD